MSAIRQKLRRFFLYKNEGEIYKRIQKLTPKAYFRCQRQELWCADKKRRLQETEKKCGSRKKMEKVFSRLFSHRGCDTLRDLVYMFYLCRYDANFIKKSWSYQNHCVFPLFSRKERSATWISSKLLIFSVDQPGLEPGTSRLWVCCSNQLSYKSNAMYSD